MSEWTEDTEMIELKPCPFCGSRDIRTTDWWDDDGEYDALECANCKGAAPADVWNKRV